jgi:RNAse (barnase) inhibitor barstar
VPTIRIATNRITDWASFHNVFAEALGFPDFYGRSLDAWRDCMAYPDEDDGLKAVVASADDPVVIVLADAQSFKERCPYEWNGIVEVVSSLNLERVENGRRPLLMLAFEPGQPPYIGYGTLEPPAPGEPERQPGWKIVR